MAIVLKKERPAIDVVQDSFTRPGKPWAFLGDPPIRARVEAAIRAVGRLETPSAPDMAWSGTGFAVGKDLIMTVSYARVDTIERIDFTLEVVPRETISAAVESVVLVHPVLNIAILRAKLPASVQPLRLAGHAPKKGAGRDVVVLGYPAEDQRNDPTLVREVFGASYGVKRLMPGRRVRVQTGPNPPQARIVVHDASTLGGCAGAPVIDVKRGVVVGIIYAGIFLKANYAVAAWELARDARIRAAGVLFEDDAPEPDDPWRDVWTDQPGGVADAAPADQPAPAQHIMSDLQVDSSAAPVVLPSERPSIELASGRLDLSGPWKAALEAHRARIELAIRAVGRLVFDGASDSFGNCFLIGSPFALTTATFARRFADGDGLSVAIRSCYRPVADFQEALGVADPALRVPVQKVAFIHPFFDVAMLELGELPVSVGNLTLASIAPEDLAGREVAIIAHSIPSMRLAVQPGKALQMGLASNGSATVIHDCAAPLGCSGAPLVDLRSGYAVGVCHGFQSHAGGTAQPTWELARDPNTWSYNMGFRPDPRPNWLDRWNGQSHSVQPFDRPLTALASDRWTVDDALEWERQEPQDLEKLLVRYIQQPAAALYWAENVGIGPGSVDAAGPLPLVWRNIIKAAKARGRLRLLIESIVKEDDFAAAAAQLREFL